MKIKWNKNSFLVLQLPLLACATLSKKPLKQKMLDLSLSLSLSLSIWHLAHVTWSTLAVLMFRGRKTHSQSQNAFDSLTEWEEDATWFMGRNVADCTRHQLKWPREFHWTLLFCFLAPHRSFGVCYKSHKLHLSWCFISFNVFWKGAIFGTLHSLDVRSFESEKKVREEKTLWPSFVRQVNWRSFAK